MGNTQHKTVVKQYWLNQNGQIICYNEYEQQQNGNHFNRSNQPRNQQPIRMNPNNPKNLSNQSKNNKNYVQTFGANHQDVIVPSKKTNFMFNQPAFQNEFIQNQKGSFQNAKKKKIFAMNQHAPQKIQTNQLDSHDEDAQLKITIKQFQEKIKEAQQYGKKMKDPLKFKEFQQYALVNYIKKLKQMKFPQMIQDQKGISVKFIVGRIASGKSSLINSYFGTNLAIGIGETTLQTSLVYSKENIKIYDTPGQCEAFNIKILQIVKYIAISHQIYILYPDSLRTIQQMVRVIAAIKPHHTILLRTQCDRFNQQQSRSLKEEISEDYKYLKKWGLQELKIFATSSKSMNEFDNKMIRNMMVSKPKQL